MATRLSTSDAFTARGVTVDRDGTEHVRLARTYKGLPVIGGDLVVHSRAGAFKSASLTQAKPLTLSVTPTLTADAAITNAGAQFGTSFDTAPTARLAVYARTATPRLAYDVLSSVWRRTARRCACITSSTPPTARSSTSATPSRPARCRATATAPARRRRRQSSRRRPVPADRSWPAWCRSDTQWNATRRLFEMKDPTRGNTRVNDIGNGWRGFGTIVADGNNQWGNGFNTDRASAAVDASYGFAKTWDFYKTSFSRLGIRGDGVGALGVVHFQKNYDNAFWNEDCFCMAFGDGDGVNLQPLVAIDIMGHEVSHGVTHASANLIYSKESGGLNEATSDILGTLVEHYTNNPQQPPNYFIGESIFIDADEGRLRSARCSSPAWTASRTTASRTVRIRITWPSSRTARTRTTPRAWPTTSSTCSPKVRWCRRARWSRRT